MFLSFRLCQTLSWSVLENLWTILGVNHWNLLFVFIIARVNCEFVCIFMSVCLYFLADHFYEMICYCCHRVCVCVRVCVCPCVCPYRELWPDRSRFEHPVWSKRCSIHPDIRHKKTIRKVYHLPPYFGGEMGRGYGKCGKKRTKVRLFPPMRKILMFCLHLCVVPT
jgi:hypothetical protein